MSANILVNDLRCESLQNPIGIDTKQPQLSWKLIAKRHGVLQSAYQVQVSKTITWDEFVWDSGKVLSDNSIAVKYVGQALESRQRYFWRVRIWDENDSPSGWSMVAFWEMGLLNPNDWAAHWIEPEQDAAKPEPPINMFQNLGTISPQPDADYARLNPAQYLRKEFSAQKTVAKARIYATAHGIYQLSLNGARIGDIELAPEITAYDSYLQYQTYDVTKMLATGKNVLGAILGDGWYRGRIGLPGDSCQYGDKLALLLKLEIEYEDGSRETIISDESFKSSTGALVYADLFIGERYDATLENTGWDRLGFEDSAWKNVNTANFGYNNLVAQYGEPLRIVQEIKPVAIIKTPNGETVVDLGQNIHGKIRMSVQGTTKTEIVLDHAEMLDADGNFMQQIRGRNKDQRDVYVCKGEDVEVYEPFFTTHGFRYVRITGYPGEPTVDDFIGLVIASDLRESGSFTCSDERINQLQENIRWSQTGNFVSIPTDCPQRERAGFTGDAQVFIPTACFNMDVHAFFTRWLRNLQIEQREDGQVPATVPYWRSYIEMFTPIQGGAHTSAGWGDACIIIPWTLYQSYGDERVLAENYATMLRWLDYVRQEAESGIPERLGELSADARERQKHLWNTGFHFGDWLIPSLTGGYSNPFDAANATKEVVASAFYAYSTELMTQIAAVLGKEDDEQRFAELNEKIRSAFAKEYLGDDGSLPAHYQGMYVMALKMKLMPAEMRLPVTEQLVGLIAENGYRLDTGFVSVPYLLDVLSENGRQDVAYKLLFQTQCPSWLYEVVRGATTIWETWDAIAPNGEVTLASFNHYAFGAVGDWLYRHVAGLDKAQAGYKHIVIHPHPDEHLTHTKATYQSVYGEIVSGWELEDGLLRVDAKIPPNTTATLRLVGANGQLVASELPTTQSGNDLLVEVGSGTYRFEYPYSV
ncbi:MAG: family 78 glycoside hydrolase catalytic domain [Chloroflexi bacterium]|jgi:alpha-L-rhamnosidase|nr:family 78 glycoside hydrolase catalytic domain [Chloroflexota bacterium]